MLPVEEQLTILMRGVDFGDAQTYKNMEAELRQRLTESVESGKPLTVYLGIDPTGADLTLGHTVPMRKLRKFQDLGHDVTFLIGTFTALIGDPSDKDSARPQQTDEEVALERPAPSPTRPSASSTPHAPQVKYNGDWLSPLTFKDVIKLASNFTVQQFLTRDNFAKRYAKGEAIWLHEFFYALMQGYDAVATQTDVQIGGTDQLFNLMAGRKLMEAFGLKPTNRAHPAHPGRHRRPRAHGQEPRQLHRHQRHARRHVRQNHVNPRPRHAQLRRTRHLLASRPHRRAICRTGCGHSCTRAT